MVPARADDVFAALSADPTTWTEWFPGLSDGGYEGPPPYGVGSKRFVSVGRTTYRETIMAWDAPTRWTYRVDATNAPVARALLEEWTVDGRGDASIVRWTFAVDPSPLLRMTAALMPIVLGRLFRKAMANLSARLAH